MFISSPYYLMKTFLILLLPLLLTGCGVYGTGETIGYVYAVDDGIFWNRVYYKTDLQSSETDCYIFSDDSIGEQLRALSGKDKIKLKYDRHFFALTAETCNADEITGIDMVN